MKSKKRRVNSFKNWLLARDSASRISTYPKYHSFLENLDPIDRDRSQVMDLFDSITDSKCFYKFGQMVNPGLTKDAKERKINIWIANKDQHGGIIDFLECFNPPSTNMKTSIWINLDDNINETVIGLTDYQNPDSRFIYAKIPSSFDDRKIVSESKKVIQYWIEKIDFGEETANSFFKWWMENYIMVQEKYSNFLKSFESAVVEWMRTVPPEVAEKAYLIIVNNSKDEKIRRRKTNLGTKEIIDHIDQGIKEFNIPINDLRKGIGLLGNFGI